VRTALDISRCCEEYLTSRLISGRGYLEVYINPTRDELKEIISNPEFSGPHRGSTDTNHIRFSAIDDTKEVYAWFGEFALHWEVRNLLNLPRSKTMDISGIKCWECGTLDGAAEMRGNTCVMISSDFFNTARSVDVDAAREMLSYDWRWVDRYIKVTPWLSDFVKQRGKRMFGEIPKFPWM
jgi:hypothetical protein